MLEIEMKFAVEDGQRLEQCLGAWGVSASQEHQEIDQYFAAPHRDFARTDEALRLRRIGTANFVTYKGPKLDGQTKTRTEVEVPLGAGEKVARDFVQLLEHLGYRPVLAVHKKRRIYHFERGGFPLDICLDEVDGLGRFVELEIMASEEQLETARTALMHAANELGLQQSERRSYLELLLQKRAP